MKKLSLIKWMLGVKRHILTAFAKQISRIKRALRTIKTNFNGEVSDVPPPTQIRSLSNIFFCVIAGVLDQYNLSVSIFRARSMEDHSNVSASVEQAGVHVFHPKGCHGGERHEKRGDAQWRVTCKYEWLKEQGQWMLPSNIPTTLDGWLAVDKATSMQLKTLLFPPHRPYNARNKHEKVVGGQK